MSVYDSADGTRFTLKKPLAYTPPKGLIRDPSVIKHTDGWYYVAYTTGWAGNTIGLARVQGPDRLDLPARRDRRGPRRDQQLGAGMVRRPGRLGEPDPVGLDHRPAGQLPALPDHRRRRLAGHMVRAQAAGGPGPQLHRHLRGARGRALQRLRQERDQQVRRALHRPVAGRAVAGQGHGRLGRLGPVPGRPRPDPRARRRLADLFRRVHVQAVLVQRQPGRLPHLDQEDRAARAVGHGAPLHGAEGRRRARRRGQARCKSTRSPGTSTR
jgi:hypothetical protein